MKNRYMKIFMILILAIIILINIIPQKTYAENMGLGKLEEYKGDGPQTTDLNGRVEKILGIIQTIGAAVAVISLISIGIKYMLGSVEEKAEYKETLKPYIIGAIVLFTGTLLPQIIYKYASQLEIF